MEKTKNGFWGGLLCGLLLAVLLIGGVLLARTLLGVHQATRVFVGKERQELLSDYTTAKIEIIEDTIERYYLSGTDTDILEDGIYSGMVDALGDPYSVYYSADELKEIQEKSEGIYYGIGAYITKGVTDEFCTISGTIEGTPAEAAGLRAGDLIYEVDGVLAQGMETTEIVTLIKGEEGTTVTLTLVREGEDDYLYVPVERKKIESPTVDWEMKENGTAYIAITEFDDVTTDQFAEALAECKGKGMESMVLDLRGNPGGNLDTVCEIARMLVPEGLIVYTEDKNGERQEYTSEGERRVEVPMVVLVDGYSASASEILAGAIQDYGVGTIMGTTTFGKGIVQRIISLSDGSAVKLTVSKYYTPNGNDIHEKGIVPDVEVEFDADAYYNEDVDNQLEAALKYLQENLQ